MTYWNILSPIISAGITIIVFWFWKPWAASYSGEKGKNLARREDLDKLIVEMNALTRAQEETKSKISGDLWDLQTRWNQKRDIYFRLLTAILRTHHTYEELLPVLKLEEAEFRAGIIKSVRDAEVNTLLDKSSVAAEELIITISISYLFLSNEATAILNKYSSRLDAITGFEAADVNQRIKLFSGFTGELIDAGKKELNKQ